MTTLDETNTQGRGRPIPGDVAPVASHEWARLIRADETLNTKAKCVAFVIATYADADGSGIYPGRDRLAHDAAMSLATLKRIMAELVDRGLIEKTKQGNRHQRRADEWRLTMRRLDRPADIPVTPIDRGSGEPRQGHREPPSSDEHAAVGPHVIRAEREAAEVLGRYERGTDEWLEARADLAVQFSKRLSPAELRQVLDMTEAERRAAMKRAKRW